MKTKLICVWYQLKHKLDGKNKIESEEIIDSGSGPDVPHSIAVATLTELARGEKNKINE